MLPRGTSERQRKSLADTIACPVLIHSTLIIIQEDHSAITGKIESGWV